MQTETLSQQPITAAHNADEILPPTRAQTWLRRGLYGAVVAALLLMMVAPAFAQSPEAQVAERRAIFKDFGANMKKLGELSKMGVNTDKPAFAEAAKNIAVNSARPWAFFGQETSVAQANNDASATIWADPAGFRAAQEKFIQAAILLNNAAASGKASDDDLKKMVADLGATCGACHKVYKK